MYCPCYDIRRRRPAVGFQRPPELYDWTNVPTGSCSLSVRAYANGRIAGSLGVAVHVTALTLTCVIIVPADQTTYATSTGVTVVIPADAHIPVKGSQRVEFYAGTALLEADSVSLSSVHVDRRAPTRAS